MLAEVVAKRYTILTAKAFWLAEEPAVDIAAAWCAAAPRNQGGLSRQTVADTFQRSVVHVYPVR